MKYLAFLVVITAVLLASPNAARADEVFIAGFTNGCFGAACAPGASAIIPGISYSNATFSGTSAGGFRGLGGNPNPGANVNNLGSFSLSTSPNTFNTSFTLQVTFTAPQGFNNSSTTTIVSTVTGRVRAADDGGVFIDFNNTPTTFTFNDTTCGATTVPGQQSTCGSGSFSLSVNDIAIDPGQTAELNGQITGAQQAVPATAARVSLTGRVTTPTGRGIQNAVVKILGGNLSSPIQAKTNPSGYYRFPNLISGQTYVLSIYAKNYEFPETVRAVTLLEEMSNFDFVSSEDK